MIRSAKNANLVKIILHSGTSIEWGNSQILSEKILLKSEIWACLLRCMVISFLESPSDFRNSKLFCRFP
ncbi:MAG: hypothetical protein BWK80_35025 [Desulfobacteraceae bacterium IS3]|nr:MAG: hypothetical protein BWK80_35025 [Desulfobacteraceae bacterium IS3]